MIRQNNPDEHLFSQFILPSFSFQLAMLPSVIVGDIEGMEKFEAAHAAGVLLKPVIYPVNSLSPSA